MKNKLTIIGIDSLDPYVILKYRNQLPTFSKLLEKSPTLFSKSVFPVDTIPAWSSIYTGLHPGNHGILYVFDIFDPNLDELRSLDANYIKGKTFWDYCSFKKKYKTIILYPTLIYPAWEINGIMICKSPFERRINGLRSERDVDVYPKSVSDNYKIPDKFNDLWGGFPGLNNLRRWSEDGKLIIDNETKIGLDIYKNEECDLFFIYFSLLDIIQHRLWRFFDEKDPTYPGTTEFKDIILDYYKKFDYIINQFLCVHPDIRLMIISDHGHKSRPAVTANINEYLRINGYLMPNGNSNKALAIKKVKNTILEIATKFDIEHILIKVIIKNKKLIGASKSIYSSAGSIDKDRSTAFLSNFAGIKSYSHGGIQINRNMISSEGYETLRNELIALLSKLRMDNGFPLVKWAKSREKVYPGKFTSKIYPDILFEFDDNIGTGWEIYSKLYGKSYDHKVASGGHGKDAVILMHNIDMKVEKDAVSIVDIAPTILAILGANCSGIYFDGKNIFR